MVNISKDSLPPLVEDQLREYLATLFAKQTKLKHTEDILSELLSPKEYTLIAKRLAAIMLLAKGTSIRDAADILNMSTSTTTYLQREYREGHFDTLVQAYNLTPYQATRTRQKDYYTKDEALNLLASILRGGMPSYSHRRIR